MRYSIRLDKKMNKYWEDYDFRVIIGRTGVVYDREKEDTNRKKHGYSLLSAVHFLERLLLPFSKPSAFFTSEIYERNGEIRNNHLTLDDEKILVFMVTAMRPDEKVRVIFLRKANTKEKEIYINLCRQIIT